MVFTMPVHISYYLRVWYLLFKPIYLTTQDYASYYSRLDSVLFKAMRVLSTGYVDYYLRYYGYCPQGITPGGTPGEGVGYRGWGLIKNGLPIYPPLEGVPRITPEFPRFICSVVHKVRQCKAVGNQ